MYVGHAGMMGSDEGDSVRGRSGFGGLEEGRPSFGGNLLKDGSNEGGRIATGL